MLDMTGAEIPEKRKPSEVFLELWRWAEDLTSEQFAECADAWRQIVSLEEIYAAAQAARAERERAVDEAFRKLADQPFIGVLRPAEDDGTLHAPAEPADTSSVGCADTFPSRGRQGASGEGAAVTFDCASAPMDEEAAWALAEAEAKAKEAANRSAGGKAGVATRRRNLTERLEELRRRGVKMHEIAAAGPDLSISDVMNALEAKPMSPMTVQALEKACKKLEEAQE
jgi:uncharacterized protein (DUF433 family)